MGVEHEKTRLLFLSRDQYGYHRSTTQIAEALAKRHQVSYLCLDSGKPKIHAGIPVTYAGAGNQTRLKRAAALFSEIYKRRSAFDVIFSKYFPGVSLLVLLVPSKHLIVNFATRGVQNRFLPRLGFDIVMAAEAIFCRHAFVISRSLGRRILRPKAAVLPLGVDLPAAPVGLNALSSPATKTLLYVGDFRLRRLETLICGLHIYTQSSGSNDVRLRLVGGDDSLIAPLAELAEHLGVDKQVEFLGYLSGTELQAAYDGCCGGIVHVPVVRHFRGQPSTKLLEYWSHGIPVLASDTEEAREFVDESRGIIYQDSPEGFASGIQSFFAGLSHVNPPELCRRVESRSWERIASDYVEPLLKRLDSKGSKGRVRSHL